MVNIDYFPTEFAKAVNAYRRRRGLRSIRQALLEIARETGCEKPDKLYRYMSGKEAPGRDRAMRLAQILNRRPEKLWPPKPLDKGA